MSLPFTPDDLNREVAKGHVRAVRHPEFPLTIYGYTPEVQYGKLWNPVTIICRGLILDDDYKVVARPFSKFLNWQEWPPEKQEAYTSVPIRSITEKMDGSLGIGFWWNGDFHIASRGSFTSDQAQWANKNKQRFDPKNYYYGFPEESTPLFEIIAPWNRIVVDYGDREDLVLLDVLDNDTGKPVGWKLAEYWDGTTVPEYEPDLERALAVEGDGTKREGLVITWEDGERAKLKIEDYVRLHKILTDTNAVRVWEAIQDGTGATLRAMLDTVPDEFYKWVQDVSADLWDKYWDIEAAALIDFQGLVHLAEDSRKAFALEATKTPYPDLLFSLLDGKDYSASIWKRIRPEATLPFREEQA